MAGKAVISLSTGLEDPEKVTVAFLVAVGAAESGRPTLMFQAKEAVRLALDGVAAGVACDGCPPLPDLLSRYAKSRRPVHGLPDLLQRQATQQRRTAAQRRTGRYRPDVGVDRGRRGDNLQLLSPVFQLGSEPFRGENKDESASPALGGRPSQAPNFEAFAARRYCRIVSAGSRHLGLVRGGREANPDLARRASLRCFPRATRRSWARSRHEPGAAAALLTTSPGGDRSRRRRATSSLMGDASARAHVVMMKWRSVARQRGVMS